MEIHPQDGGTVQTNLPRRASNGAPGWLATDHSGRPIHSPPHKSGEARQHHHPRVPHPPVRRLPPPIMRNHLGESKTPPSCPRRSAPPIPSTLHLSGGKPSRPDPSGRHEGSYQFLEQDGGRATTVTEARGRATRTSAASFLSTLPLYNYNIWERVDLDHLGFAAHDRARLDGIHPPQWIIPDETWWLRNAIAVLQLAEREIRACSPNSISSLLQHTRLHFGGDNAYHHGVLIPSSLPTNDSSHHAEHIFSSALIIQAVDWGVDSLDSSLELSRHILTIAEGLFDEKLEPSFDYSSSPSSAAMSSARSATKYLRRLLHEATVAKEKTAALRLQQQQEAEADDRKRAHFLDREQAWRTSRAASKQLWREVEAASTINRWLLRALSARRSRARARIRSFCRGASTHARTVKTRRSIPTSAPPLQPLKPSLLHKSKTHPFRLRGLHLPRKKRRKARRRPPKHQRGLPIPFYPAEEELHQHDPQDDHQSPPTASPSRPPIAAVPPNSFTSPHPPKYLTTAKLGGSHTTILPLCVWAAQTTAAALEFSLCSHPVADLRHTSPESAARAIQRAYRTSTQRRLAHTTLTHKHSTAGAIQRHFRGFLLRKKVRMVTQQLSERKRIGLGAESDMSAGDILRKRIGLSAEPALPAFIFDEEDWKQLARKNTDIGRKIADNSKRLAAAQKSLAASQKCLAADMQRYAAEDERIKPAFYGNPVRTTAVSESPSQFEREEEAILARREQEAAAMILQQGQAARVIQSCCRSSLFRRRLRPHPEGPLYDCAQKHSRCLMELAHQRGAEAHEVQRLQLRLQTLEDDMHFVRMLIDIDLYSDCFGLKRLIRSTCNHLDPTDRDLYISQQLNATQNMKNNYHWIRHLMNLRDDASL
eukprot:CAMPEP_0181099578 /NCGR_PEP_ID=MMETSP1071-20121207/12733_1 /TAXON_ID=35127 /ORGANISM="Thalassiosira sp., Strain NH16" /LENGTH=878 /DNA_ID=CAMNT_0023182247 /DNA_START=1249 /DNA_END=3885 /DNA_ORIENTATION=-